MLVQYVVFIAVIFLALNTAKNPVSSLSLFFFIFCCICISLSSIDSMQYFLNVVIPGLQSGFAMDFY